MIKTPHYKRFRITTPDADFLDIDYLQNNNTQAVVLIHGLEGSSNSAYINSLSNQLHKNNFDVFAINLRGCSGTPNLTKKSYNSGCTEDVKLVINYINNNYTYNKLSLTGFSLGGNLVLKYLGENTENSIYKAVAISVPCDLKTSSLQLKKGFNKVYTAIFVKQLKQKLLQKINQFPDFELSKQQILNIKTVHELDELYTAPFHGYKNADDYYTKCSSKQFIKNIKTPTLLINALDDSFLTPECFPYKEAKANPNFTFLTPKYGGHVGFMSGLKDEALWVEKLILDYLLSK